MSYSAPVNKGQINERHVDKSADKSQDKGTEKGGDKTEPKEAAEKSEKTKPLKWPPEPVLENVHKVTTEELVNKPHEFLNKNVKFTANFYAFSNLALDFKPALRPAKEYLSFIVHRPGSHIPFSELKLSMKIPKEKDPENQLLAQLKDGDQLDILGKVFATSLEEPWVDVVWLKKLNTSKEDKKAALDETDSPSKPPKKKEKPAGLEEESKSEGMRNIEVRPKHSPLETPPVLRRNELEPGRTKLKLQKIK